MRFISLLMAIAVIGSGCSGSLSEAERSAAANCRARIQVAMKSMEASGGDRSPQKVETHAEVVQKSLSMQYSYLSWVASALEVGAQAETTRAYLRDYETCGAKSIQTTNPTYVENWMKNNRPLAPAANEMGGDSYCAQLAQIGADAFRTKFEGYAMETVLERVGETLAADSQRRVAAQGAIIAIYGDGSIKSAKQAYSAVYSGCKR